MSTPAGYYIGFRDVDGSPYSRETEYFASKSEAEDKLEMFKTVIAASPALAKGLSFVRGC
jgi:hypothetical protein